MRDFEEHDPPADYIEGFNKGYLLRKHTPEFTSKSISDNKTQSDYQMGLEDGMKQYEMEIGKSLDKGHFKGDKWRDKDKDKSVER